MQSNEISRGKIEFYPGRPGGQASLSLTNKFGFRFFSDGNTTEIVYFRDRNSREEENLSKAPPEKVAAFRALSSQNKLDDESALALAKKYFRMLGHREEDFLPVEFRQFFSGEKSDSYYMAFPFYEAVWFRKDVKLKHRESGIVALPQVHIIVSGLSTNLVYYSKLFMPIGSDF